MTVEYPYYRLFYFTRGLTLGFVSSSGKGLRPELLAFSFKRLLTITLEFPPYTIQDLIDFSHSNNSSPLMGPR